MFELRPLMRTLAAAQRDAQHPKVRVRISAVRDLGKLAASPAEGASNPDSEVAVATLCRLLEDDADPEVRARAAVALADAEARSALPALLRGADDLQPRVRQMALLALGELADSGSADVERTLRAALSSPLPALRFQALLAAARVRSSDLSAALQRALHDDDPHLRYLALRILDEQPAAFTPALDRLSTSALEDSDPQVRVAAALLLTSSTQPDATQGSGARVHPDAAKRVLCDALNGGLQLPAPEDQQQLIEQVAELGLHAAIPGLRRQAWGAFGLMPGRFAWQARVSLVRLGDVAAQRHLRKALASSRAEVRRLSVVAAGQARWTEVRQELEALLSNGRVERQTVEAALAMLGADLEQRS
jgi:HEAT repeat protein